MVETAWLTSEQQRAWRAYRRMRTVLDLELERDLRQDSGLSDVDYDVLSTVSESSDGTWRSRDLAERLLWSSSRLAHQIGRMEKRGLVRRAAATDDGRGAVVSLTAQGKRVLRSAAPPHVESVRRNLIDLLTPTEIATLDRIARKVLANLGHSGVPGSD